MKIPSLLLGAVLTVGLVPFSSAKTTDLGTLAEGSTQYFFDAGLSDHFTNYINFDLASAGSLSDGFIFSPNMKNISRIKDFSLSLQMDEAGSWISLASFGSSGNFKSSNFSFDKLVAGSYRLVLDGIGSGSFGGSYLTGFNVAAATPEAETWAMLLVGFGLVGYQLSRKQKSLEQQLLT